jgi:hypothetical protein
VTKWSSDCPYCASANTVADGPEVDGSMAWENWACGACHRTWQQVYEWTHCEDATGEPMRCTNCGDELPSHDSDCPGALPEPPTALGVPISTVARCPEKRLDPAHYMVTCAHFGGPT